jgi:hypothetical protein
MMGSIKATFDYWSRCVGLSFDMSMFRLGVGGGGRGLVNKHMEEC